MDRLKEMEAFAAVVDQGGFTGAAKKIGLSKSAISKLVAALEARLGARLIDRTTRRISPTEIGLAYYDSARRVLNAVTEADATARSMQSTPTGILRFTVATDFGVTHIGPILGAFLSQFPDISVNMVLKNRYVELVSEGFDMAVRIGDADDSTLFVRKLTDIRMRMIASPAYFKEFGQPARIDDLKEHRLLHYSDQAGGNVWKLISPSGEQRELRTGGRLSVNDGGSLLSAAISGLGIAYLPSFLYAPAMRRGLVADAIPGLPAQKMTICAVTPPELSGRPKVRAMMDFLESAFAGKDPEDW